MSFTVYHIKRNGSVKPIKMSIFDAFRGAPAVKARNSKPCTCCGKHHPDSAKVEVKTNTRANHYHNYHEEKKESHGDIKLSEDDRILLRMKGEKQGRPWADILAVTSFKDKHEAHVRYNEIKHLADNEKKNNANQDKKKDVDKDKVERAAKKREEGLRKQAEAREKKEAAEKAEKATDERWERFLKEQEKEKEKEVEHDAAKPKKRTSFAISRPQNSLNKRETQSRAPTYGHEHKSIKELAESYDRKKWQVLASRHYDRTGERITPEMARKMAQ